MHRDRPRRHPANPQPFARLEALDARRSRARGGPALVLDRQAERVGYRARFVADPDEVHLDPALATAAFRVAQEALTNVARHARRMRVWLRLRVRDGVLRLVVRDDGVGFDPEVILRRGVRGEGVGLLGMRERASLLGGRVVIRSAIGRGTEIWLMVPVAQPGEEASAWIRSAS